VYTSVVLMLACPRSSVPKQIVGKEHIGQGDVAAVADGAAELDCNGIAVAQGDQVGAAVGGDGNAWVTDFASSQCAHQGKDYGYRNDGKNRDF